MTVKQTRKVRQYGWLLAAALAAGAAQAADKSGAQFEEYRPAVKELAPGSVAAPQNQAPTQKATSQPNSATALPGVETKPVTPPAPPAAMSPIAVPPASTTNTGVDATRSVALPDAGMSSDREFRQNLKDLENRIESLKERVIETKSRLLNYSQKVAKGFAAGTQVALQLQNDLGSDFQVEKVSFFLDGHQVYLKEFDLEEGVIELDVYRGSVLPGRHRIDVELIVRGDEGIFDFGHDARLKLESGEYFNANEGKVLQIELVMFDRGGVFKKIDSRPGMRFDIEERDVF